VFRQEDSMTKTLLALATVLTLVAPAAADWRTDVRRQLPGNVLQDLEERIDLDSADREEVDEVYQDLTGSYDLEQDVVFHDSEEEE
jgi:hypothetical protein